MVDLVWAGMEDLKQQLERFATATDLPVLLLGETGAGKSQIARWIHEQSARAAGRFESINAGAIPEHLIETELFGHEKGAFTGAERMKHGRFELADGGTLFLDEIGSAPASVQTKLLKALEDSTVRRVGGTVDHKVDVRMIYATNCDLQQLVHENRFREDLYWRIAEPTFRVPSLRERPQRIAPIFRRCFKEGSQLGQATEPPELSAGLLDLIARRRWPGNARQLCSAAKLLRIQCSQKSRADIDDFKQLPLSYAEPVDSSATFESSTEALDSTPPEHIPELVPHVNAMCAAAGVVGPASRALVRQVAEVIVSDGAWTDSNSPVCAAARRALVEKVEVPDQWPLRRQLQAAVAAVIRWDCGRRDSPMTMRELEQTFSRSFKKGSKAPPFLKPIASWLLERQRTT